MLRIGTKVYPIKNLANVHEEIKDREFTNIESLYGIVVHNYQNSWYAVYWCDAEKGDNIGCLKLNCNENELTTNQEEFIDLYNSYNWEEYDEEEYEGEE